MRGLLSADIGTPIDILLRSDNVTSLRKLRQLIKKPGLDNKLWKDPNDGDKEKELSEEQHEDLLALGSYLNWLQSGFALCHLS